MDKKKTIRKLRKMVREQQQEIEDLKAQLLLFTPATSPYEYVYPVAPYPGHRDYPHT